MMCYADISVHPLNACIRLVIQTYSLGNKNLGRIASSRVFYKLNFYIRNHNAIAFEALLEKLIKNILLVVISMLLSNAASSYAD